MTKLVALFKFWKKHVFFYLCQDYFIAILIISPRSQNIYHNHSSFIESVWISFDIKLKMASFPQNDQVLQGFSVDKGEFTCPLCRQFANSVLPCRPGRGTEAGAWHSATNKTTTVLVKEVEDLQEKLGLFPVSFIAKHL